MMTRHEAHQRAAVYGAHIKHKHTPEGVKFAAVLPTWTHLQRRQRTIWREDIEDAVLDCGRLKP